MAICSYKGRAGSLLRAFTHICSLCQCVTVRKIALTNFCRFCLSAHSDFAFLCFLKINALQCIRVRLAANFVFYGILRRFYIVYARARPSAYNINNILTAAQTNKKRMPRTARRPPRRAGQKQCKIGTKRLQKLTNILQLTKKIFEKSILLQLYYK